MSVDTIIEPFFYRSYTLPSSIENSSIENDTSSYKIASVLIGNDSNNTLTGNNGNNSLFGENGSDSLLGGAGNDRLNGGDGDDTITGGKGQDVLIGGLGADRFMFNSKTETSNLSFDIIANFSHNEGDKIDLSNIDANISNAGNDAFSKLSVGTGDRGYFKTGPAGLYFNSNSHMLYGNIDGDRIFDFAIKLSGVTDLFAPDLIM